MAGLLTCFPFECLPIRQMAISDLRISKSYIKLTAAGTVQDSHLIPFNAYHFELD